MAAAPAAAEEDLFGVVGWGGFLALVAEGEEEEWRRRRRAKKTEKRKPSEEAPFTMKTREGKRPAVSAGHGLPCVQN